MKLALAPTVFSGLHALALAAMGPVLSGGTAIEPDLHVRMRYVAEHATAWRLGWALWMASAVSLPFFYAWWGRRAGGVRLLRIVMPIAVLGVAADLSGEMFLATDLVESSRELPDELPDEFLRVERLATLLTGGAANGLYTLAGFILMLATARLPAWVRLAMWTTWIAGAVMTVSAIADFVPGLVGSSAALFPCLIVWSAWMGLGERSFLREGERS